MTTTGGFRRGVLLGTTVVGLLLQKGADPGALDALGKRPIDYARENDKERIVELLAAL